MPMADPWPASPYYVLVARKTEAPRCWAWPAFSLRRLQPVPIPLAAPDPDVTLDIQPVIDRIYEKSGYGREIDYHRPLDPPLADDERHWLEQHLPSSPTSTNAE